MGQWGRLGIIFVVGGVLGALCDQMHTQLGVLHYPEPVLLGQAWWVMPLFGAGTVGFYLLARQLILRAQSPVPEHSATALGLALASFLGAYFASCFMRGFELEGALVLGVSWLLRVAFAPGRRELVIYSVALAISGTLWEAGFSSTGAFLYDHAAYGVVPVWLPGIYAHFAPFGMAATRRLLRAELEPAAARG